ncbi:MAG: undecaprenyl-diphosphate phosphatase [Bacteroidia bacterium]|nr:undecaprenyl-diphosphate phosphatase [Bacteroidia bacterium]MDW8088340.1 undecaprenyl-diphosphate phosphatase [Bacteroidia bacterium]
MSLWEALLLALVEGLTEFLPISSTGHLVLLSAWLGKEKEAFFQSYEIIIQGGAILAVLFYRWRRWRELQLYPLLVAAFLPTAGLGLLLRGTVEPLLSQPAVVGLNLVVGGFLLIGMDRWFRQNKGVLEGLSLRQAFVIGLVQAISLFPGISRAAAALLGAQLVGLNKSAAAEFSFLLAVPTLGAASAYKFWRMPTALLEAHWDLLLLGSGVAFGVALLAMRFLLSIWQRWGLAPFGLYRIGLGSAVLLWR